MIREARRIINHGITVEDIDRFMRNPEGFEGASAIGLEKPCCGGDKVDAEVKAFREKQERLRVERLK